MASESNVEEERDAVVVYLRNRAKNWRVLVDSEYSEMVAGEFDDVADEIEAGRHWHPSE